MVTSWTPSERSDSVMEIERPNNWLNVNIESLQINYVTYVINGNPVRKRKLVHQRRRRNQKIKKNSKN